MEVDRPALLPIPGDTVALESELTCPKARGFAIAVRRLPFVRLIACRTDSKRPNIEIVVVEVEVERGQYVRHPVNRLETLGIEFDRRDKDAPAVLALRSDFPRVPHLNSLENDLPRSLCLSESPYAEERLHWTPSGFLERIREWLARTADGSLHPEDQPLEPLLLLGNWRLILPSDFSAPEKRDLQFVIVEQMLSKSHHTYYAHRVSECPGASPNGIVLSVLGAPHIHGVIEKLPQDINQLHTLLKTVGIDLLESVRGAVRRAIDQSIFKTASQTYLIIFVTFPKKRRHTDDEAETFERWAFVCLRKMREIGESIGVLDSSSGASGFVLDPEKGKTGESTPLIVLQPHFRLSPEAASAYNGVEASSSRYTLVGVGALGSQLYVNLMRTGFGQWNLVDSDIVLPHNLARHALVNSLGVAKAEALAQFSRLVIDGEAAVAAVDADVLSFPDTDDAALRAAISEAAAIVDCSASQAVARHLAIDITAQSRRCSAFLNPSATDLVLLCEPSDRGIRLDDLELQYYRMILRTRALWKHYVLNGRKIRYSTGCRDVSAVIPQEFVALYAAVASRALRTALSVVEGCISVWTLSQESMETKQYSLRPRKTHIENTSGWSIRFDDGLLHTLRRLREARLPAETGGVLLGSFDMVRKIVYIIDLLPAPSDSIEKPHFFVRGSKGLRSSLNSVAEITYGQLKYVGEWHTHPDGCGVAASLDDKNLLESLSRLMAEDGVPEVMFIIGEARQYSVHLRDLTSR